MPSTPTTRSQVQAYRFVLKRMESALVRRDAVMLHDPMRTHVRAGLVGFFLALLALIAFVVFHAINKDKDWHELSIAVGKESGAMYVVIHNPDRLVPVPNLASARLILAADAAAHNGNAAPAGEAVQPEVVSDSALADAPRTPQAGLPGAPSALPSPDQRIPDRWALCDTVTPNTALPDPNADPPLSTTVLAGIEQPGRSLGPDEGLLVRSATGVTYLVYDGRRHQIDLTNVAVRRALDLDNVVPRKVSTGFLNAVPEAKPIVVPQIPEDGAPAPVNLAGLPVGGVFRVERTGAPEDYYVIFPNGVQKVQRSVADLVRFADSNPRSAGEIPTVPPSALPATVQVIDLGAYPSTAPRTVGYEAAHTTCLDWRFVDGRQQTAITVADTVPSPAAPTHLAQDDGSGDNVDFAYVPGRGAAVRSIVAGQPPDTGTIWVVSGTGVKFGVPDVPTAKILGIGEQFDPAPDSIVRLLPTGPSLDLYSAQQTYTAATQSSPAAGR